MSPDPSRTTRRRLLGACAGLGTLFGTGIGTANGTETTARTRSTATGVPASSASQDAQEGSAAAVYEESIDDVVLVNVFGAGDGAPGEPADDEPAPPGGIGSGFVVDDHVVTNHHVVGAADTVELQFRDEQWREGSVVGSDIHSDLAVLEVAELPDEVDGLDFADADPTIGEDVLALGNPLGLDASISQGIVSGTDRSLPSPTGFSIPAAIQTDAPVNPGNSGGPLVNLEGDVVGVVFAGAGQTIGFAISAALATRVLPSLLEDGSYEQPYMGVSVLPVGPLIAEANDLSEPGGVMVIETVPDGPADGLLEPASPGPTVDGAAVPVDGDVIVAIDDQEIPNQAQLSSTLALETAPDETVPIELIRDGEQETVDLTLEARPDDVGMS